MSKVTTKAPKAAKAAKVTTKGNGKAVILSSDVLAQKAEEAKRAAEEAKRELQRAKSEETKLSKDEQKALANAETAVQKYQTGDWRIAAAALAVIRDRKLHRATHSSWEKYLAQRWDLQKRTTDTWILGNRVTQGMPSIEKMGLTCALALVGNLDSDKGHVTSQGEREEAWAKALKAAGSKHMVPVRMVKDAMSKFVPANTQDEATGGEEVPNGTTVTVTETDTWELLAPTVQQLRQHGIQSATELVGLIEQLAEMAGDQTFDAFLADARNSTE